MRGSLALLLAGMACAGCFFPDPTVVDLTGDVGDSDTGRPGTGDTGATADTAQDVADEPEPEPGLRAADAVVALRSGDLTWTGVAVGDGVIVSVMPTDVRMPLTDLGWQDARGNRGDVSREDVHPTEDGLLVVEAPGYDGPMLPLSDGVGINGPDLVIGHPAFARGLGGWIPFVPQYDETDASLVLAPDDPGLDGAPVLTRCGGVKALLVPDAGRVEPREPPAATPEAAALQPEPALACFSGHRRTLPATRIQSELRTLGLASVAPDGCERPVDVPRSVYSAAPPVELTPGAAALLARIRHSVVWVAGNAGVISADWEAIIAPASAAREVHDIYLEDGTVLSPTPFSNFRVIGNGLAVSFWPGARDEGLVSGASDTLREGDAVYLIGHSQGIGCGNGWTVTTLRYSGRTPDTLYFSGSVYADGGAVVTTTGELLGLAVGCTGDATVAPAPEGSGALPLDPGCAVVVSTLPDDERP